MSDTKIDSEGYELSMGNNYLEYNSVYDANDLISNGFGSYIKNIPYCHEDNVDSSDGYIRGYISLKPFYNG